MCFSFSVHNDLQAAFGLAVITSGNHRQAYIRLAWPPAIGSPNDFLWSWHDAAWLWTSLFVGFLIDDDK